MTTEQLLAELAVQAPLVLAIWFALNRRIRALENKVETLCKSVSSPPPPPSPAS